MTYLLDPRPYGYDGRPLRCAYEATIVLVGCGGTGGFLADALGRLLLGRDARLFLVDLDRVEPHNLGRQAFLYGIRRVRQYLAAQECDSGR